VLTQVAYSRRSLAEARQFGELLPSLALTQPQHADHWLTSGVEHTYSTYARATRPSSVDHVKFGLKADCECRQSREMGYQALGI
jgi:hypothetical protein